MENTITINHFIPKSKEKTYYEIPFDIPENTRRVDVRYTYTRHVQSPAEGSGVATTEANIVDLGLSSRAFGFIGTSGSNRSHIWVSASECSKGYYRVNPSGSWSILVGAYEIQDAGLDVTYTITFTSKERTLYRGDCHMHTLGSDGKLTVAEIAHMARGTGLDFIIVTDHNNTACNLEIPAVEGITVIPGMEWTHYNGHANMIGVPRPVKHPFCTNDEAGMRAIMQEAKDNGAIIVLNHSQCPDRPWKWGFDVPFDALEIWNAMMLGAYQRQIVWWHDRLCEGKKIPILAGSDFHRLTVGSMVGMPCTWVYAMSNSGEDILAALTGGHSFVTLDPDSPTIYAQAGGKILGETAGKGETVSVRFERLEKGDELHTITHEGRKVFTSSSKLSSIEFTHDPNNSSFMRFEIHRKSLVFMSDCPILISNPIYFE